MGKNKKKGNKKKHNHIPSAVSVEDDSENHNDNSLNIKSLVDRKLSSDIDNIDEKGSVDNAPQNDDEKEEREEEQEEEEYTSTNIDNTLEQEKLKDNIDDNNTREITDTKRQDSEEVINLRREIEILQKQLNVHRNNSSEDSNIVMELEKVKNERDRLENQYNTLLSKISSMKNVFNKMKESQQELETVQEQLTEYESQNTKMKNKLASVSKDNEELVHTITTLNKELSTLENDYEALQNKCDEYENTISEYETQLEDHDNRNDYQIKEYQSKISELNSEIEELSMIIENTKQDLRDLKDERKGLKSYSETLQKNEGHLKETINELETTIQNNETIFKEEIKDKDQQIKSLRIQLDNSVDNGEVLSGEIKNLESEIEKLKEIAELKDKFEKESKEQVLQIGKLRHEAIILNEHLRKALGMLKQSSESETVDKELISNLLISFVSIPRADPKKFEVLQLLSNFLNWDDDKKQQAGLMNNPNKSQKRNGPVSRTQSFVSLWTEFLEKESEL